MADSKTYTVHVEPDDDLQQVRAQLESLPEGHVILLAPNGNRILRSVAAMRLVRRSLSQEWAVAIVSPDPEIQASARRAGLSVHLSFGQASNAISTGRYRRQSAGLGLAGAGIAGATGLGISLLLVAVFILGTWTEVTVEPVSRQVEGQVALNLAYQPPAEPGWILAVEHTKLLELGHQIPTSGVRAQIERQAEGVVTIAKRRERAITIPAGTSVWNESGVRFFTNSPVDLPAGMSTKARVNIIAESVGEAGNLPRGSITQVDLRFADEMSVFNEEATEGGGLLSASVVTSSDIEKLRSHVVEMARQKAMAQIASMFDSDTLALVALSKLSVIDEQFSHKPGEESKTLQLRSQIMVRTPVISSSALNQAVSALWNQELPGGWSINPTALRILQMTPEFDGDSEKLIVAARGRAARHIVDSEVAAAVRLKSADQAREALIDDFPLASQPLVVVHPDWPGISFRVDVQIVEDRAPERAENVRY